MVPSDCGDFTECIDFDSDGNYEVTTDESQAFRINGTKINSTAIDMSSLTNLPVNSRPLPPSSAPDIVSEVSTGF